MLKAEYSKVINSIRDENKVLQDKTLKFWSIARCWNGVEDSTMKVQEAFDIIRSIQSELNPQRPLCIGLEHLKDDIVEHGSKAQQQRYQKKNPRPQARLVVIA